MPVVVVNQFGGGLARTIEQLKVGLSLGGADGALHHISDRHGCKNQAEQGSLPLLRRRRIAACAINRQEVKPPSGRRQVRVERNFSAQGRLTGADGALDGITPDPVGAGVHAQSGQMVFFGLDELHDVLDIRSGVPVYRSSHGKARFAVCACGSDEALQVLAPDPLHETKTPYAGKLSRQLTGLHIGTKLAALDAHAGRVHPGSPAQAGQRCIQARLHIGLHALDEAVKAQLRFAPKIVLSPPHAKDGQRQAEDKRQ